MGSRSRRFESCHLDQERKFKGEFNMSYYDFKNHITNLIKTTGQNINVEFSTDKDKGIYIAVLSDGTVITVPFRGFKMTVRWGSGHVAMASV